MPSGDERPIEVCGVGAEFDINSTRSVASGLPMWVVSMNSMYSSTYRIYSIRCLATLWLWATQSSAAPMDKPDIKTLQDQVFSTERAFAKTMADRNFTAFADFVSEEAIFFGGAAPLRGREQVLAGWKRFYDKPQAPFSWEPEQVEVLPSGTLAHSSGPVRDATGKLIATFNSIWRLEAPGKWRVVFDKGSEACDCVKP